MIIDMNAWAGYWSAYPVQGEVSQVRSSLREIGVERMLLSPMHAVWCHNPHLCNDLVYQAAEEYPDIDPVPVLDPTIPTWLEELGRALHAPRARWIKLIPAYSRYTLEGADGLLSALARAGMGVIIQTRLEDPRRQHPLAQVADTPVKAVVSAARRHPNLEFIIGGGSWAAIQEARTEIAKLPNLFAETSQLDGVDSLKSLIEWGLAPKILFGTHSPFFVPLAGLARVLNDLEDGTAYDILGGNAQKLLKK